MEIAAIGTIHMQPTKCLRCDSKIHSSSSMARSEGLNCSECGAHYEYTRRHLGKDQVDFHFKFSGFRCMKRKSFGSNCDNVCPGPGMYCEEHTDEKAFEEARNSIKYAEQRLEESKEEMKRMEESKRLWLVNEVSGIDE